MSTVNLNFTENQQEILRSLVDINLKPAATLAVNAGINRGSMVSAIGGYRSIPAAKLHNLLNAFNLNDRWEPSISVAHYLRVGADIDSLIRVIDVVYGSCKMHYIQAPGAKPILWEPFTGFFVFEFITEDGKGLVLVHRDRFRSGKGVVNTNPYEAKAIEPEIFKNVVWADNPIIELPEDVIKLLEYPFYNRVDGPDLNRLREILNMAAYITWTDVRAAADRLKLSAEDIMHLIEQSHPSS